MKYLITIFALLVLSGCGVTTDIIPSADNSQDKDTLDQVVSKLDTPEKCFEWMQNNFTYTPDICHEDEYRPAQETFKLRTGDCDDYAMFAEYVLSQHGYNTYILSVFNATNGHAVCVYDTGYLSNNIIITMDTSNIKDVAYSVYKDYKYFIKGVN